MDPVVSPGNTPIPDPPVSPTGVAIIPAKIVPYLLAGLALLGALIGLGMGTPPVLPVLVPAVPYMQKAVAILTVVLGLTPGLRKAAPMVLLALALLWSSPASAQVTYSVGPTIPLLKYTPGQTHPVSVQPGAGVQLSLSLEQLQKPILGKSWDMLSLDAMAFGTIISKDSGAEFGALSLGLAACTMSSLVCVGGGKDLLDTNGLSPAKEGWFMLLAFSFNVDFAPPSTPKTLCASADDAACVPVAPKLHRGNTLYIGSN